MKNLFSMFSTPIVEEKKKYNIDIETIHNEFFTASEKLLADAKLILDNNINVEKCNRLKALGFNSVPEVVQLDEQQKELEGNKKLLDTISYFKKEYPFHKFISAQQVKEICEKYSLVQGKVDWYKGFVPESNLKQIENFKLKEKDRLFIGVMRDGTEIEFPYNIVIHKEHGDYYHMYKSGKSTIFSDSAFQSDDGIDWYADDENNIFGLKHLRSIRFTLEPSSTLSICAPIKYMNVPSNYKLVGHKYVKEIEDPVVLCRVRGGYLIVTAWGDEASDEIIINPINN